jgi:GntR family transcriptional regulator
MSRRQSGSIEKPEQLSGRRRRADEVSRIRDLLRTEIVCGRYGTQGLLPAEPELMLEYVVGRNVVRECLDLLRDEGLIERIQGSGTFILSTKAQHSFDRVHAIHDSVRPSGRVSGTVLSMTTVTAPRPVAEQLQITPGAACTLIEYTAVIAGAPFSLSTSYLPLTVGAMLDQSIFNGDFYELLEAANFTVSGGDMTIEAVSADDRAAATLQILPGSPLIMFHRKLASPDGSPLEYGFVRCRGDRLSLQVQLPRSVAPKKELAR